jgi:Cdc6-like AAA superfamily ATPase
MNDFAMGRPNLSNNFLPTTRTTTAEMRLEMLFELGWQADYCKALPLLGPPGTGKTLFIKEYAALFECQYKRKLRYLYVEVPSSASTNGVASKMLDCLGDAAPTYGIETAKVARIVGHMKGRFDILYLDEFQRLIDRNTEKVDKKAAGLVATLLNERVCPIVLVGEVQSERVFADSMHFEDRTFAPYG